MEVCIVISDSIRNVVIQSHAVNYHINYMHVILTLFLGFLAIKLYDIAYSARGNFISAFCFITSLMATFSAIFMVINLADNSFGNNDHATFDGFAKNFKKSTGYELLPDSMLRDTFTISTTADADGVVFSSPAYQGTHIVKCDFTNITNVKEAQNLRFIGNCK